MNVREISNAFARNPVVTGYLAADGYVAQASAELPHALGTFGRLILAAGEPLPVFWAQNIWKNVRIQKIDSIKSAAKFLAGIQRNWWSYGHILQRRIGLVQEQLPHISAKHQEFPLVIPSSPLGSWTMIDPGIIIYANDCSSPFPNGEIKFSENHSGPPSRAYLKLWEALSVAGKLPQPGELCIDLGASPGGWTWVLHQLKANVIAIDRSPLAPELMNQPNIEFRETSAFSCQPNEFEKMDWLLSDVICYPDRLYEFVTRWLKSGKCKNYICTLKFQNPEHYPYAKKFAEIPGSKVVHLSNNKHELTWILTQN